MKSKRIIVFITSIFNCIKNNKVKILVVEDDILLGEQIRRFLSKDYELLGIATKGESALAFIDENQPDLVLMDIELDGQLDGVETAEKIQEKLFIPVIYLTKLHDDRTLKRVKKTMPAAYLSKPFKNHDLKYAIENAIYARQLQPNRKNDAAQIKNETFNVSVFNDRLFCKTGTGQILRLFINDIVFIELIGRECHIITIHGTEHINISLKDFFAGINDGPLLRIHRRFGININYMKHFNKNMIVMEYPDPNVLNAKIEKEFSIVFENYKKLMKKLGMIK